MLLLIETQGRTCIVEIADGSYDNISKAFEEIGRPELVAKGITEKSPMEVGKEYELYDWDDMADVIQGKPLSAQETLEEVDAVGKIYISDEKFVWVNGDVEE